MRSGPSAWHHALGPGDRPWIESAVGEVVAELILLIGDDQHVVAYALRKAGDFGLDREMPGIRPPRSRDECPGLLLDDVSLEFLCGVPDVAGEFAVALAMADNQQELGPALGDEILDKAVSEHRPARQQMEDIGPAVLGAPPILRP